MKIDMRLVKGEASDIKEASSQTPGFHHQSSYTLDGRVVNKAEGLRKGIYIVNGTKRVVK